MPQLRTMRRPWSVAGLLVGLFWVGLAVAQTPQAVDAGGAAEAPSADAGNGPRIEYNPDTGLITALHLRPMPLGTAVELLSRRTRTNIVATTTSGVTVSANLYDVTLDDALRALLAPANLSFRRVENVIYVGTPEALLTNGPPPEARIFPLRYITRAEATLAVTPLLSADGVITAEPEDDTSQEMAFGGAGSNYLVIMDYPERLDQIGRLLADLDVRPKQVLIEATILRATLNENNQLGVDLTLLGGMDFGNVNGSSEATTNLSLGNTPQARLDDTTFNVSTQTIGNFPQGGFTFGVISNSVAAFIRALESVTDVTVLAHPKVVTLNKQTAEMIVGRRDGYITTTVTETAAIETVEFLETGVQIKLRPLINDDGTVRLDVRPKDSNGALNASNLPFEETTEAHAQILIDDGHTVLIGGLFRERTVGSNSQVPLLGNVPGLGLLFRGANDQTVREEVIILLTVRVLKETPDEHRQFDRLMENIERLRVGARRGLLGSGRERLSQAYYQEALKQTQAGNQDLALLNARMAIHCQPGHAGALNLKDRLLGERMWDTETTRVRTFLMDMLDGNESVDRFGRPRLHEQLLRGLPSDVLNEAE